MNSVRDLPTTAAAVSINSRVWRVTRRFIVVVRVAAFSADRPRAAAGMIVCPLAACGGYLDGAYKAQPYTHGQYDERIARALVPACAREHTPFPAAGRPTRSTGRPACLTDRGGRSGAGGGAIGAPALVGCADLGRVGLARDHGPAYIYYPNGRVAAGRHGPGLALVYLHDLPVIALASKRPFDGVGIRPEGVRADLRAPKNAGADIGGLMQQRYRLSRAKGALRICDVALGAQRRIESSRNR